MCSQNDIVEAAPSGLGALFGAIECQSLASMTSTEPAGAVACSSPGIGMRLSIPSSTTSGLRGSECERGTSHVPAASWLLSLKYQTVLIAIGTGGKGGRIAPECPPALMS